VKKIFLICICLFPFFSKAQVLVKGKLLLEDFSTTKISVLNKNSNQTVTTDWNGVFEMEMKQMDTLVFYQKDIFFDELIVPIHVIENKALRYFLKKEGTHLDELVIDKGPLFNFGGKKLSKVEKLEVQNATKIVRNNSIGITTDAFFNRIFGRTKNIKKVISLEKKASDFTEFKFIYSDDILINEFKVPKDNVNMFVFYVIDSEGFNIEGVSAEKAYKFFLHNKVEDFKKELER